MGASGEKYGGEEEVEPCQLHMLIKWMMNNELIKRDATFRTARLVNIETTTLCFCISGMDY